LRSTVTLPVRWASWSAEEIAMSTRLLHKEGAHAIQQRLQFRGLQAIVLPIRVLEQNAAFRLAQPALPRAP
jgi:hypothetical protein